MNEIDTDMIAKEELKEVNTELKAVEAQIEQLLERQQELLERRKCLEDQVLNGEACSLKQNCTNSDPAAWRGCDFPWCKDMEDTKERVFKISKFRPLQLETMNATMSGVDCILVMPTGGGKSLCFQLPAVISSGITLVVSPLVSLMEDQLMALQELKIESALLNASSSKEEVNAVHSAMTDKKSSLKILYVTPEKIAKSKRFMAKLEKTFQADRLSRIVIDEVHCASQWGHDFRPDYKILGILKRQFPGVPILGLTATATVKVVEDVKKILGLEDQCILFKASFNRANLYYEVCPKPSSQEMCMNKICNLITKRFSGESGIIYCFSRKDAEQVTQALVSRGISAACYHAYMEARSRSHVHRAWTRNKIKVVVATVAFGMGIDKPNVRFVIHHSLSKSMENYYQESGRAGRDDAKSHCIVFYRPFDIFRQSTMVFIEQTGLENLYGMTAYCQQSMCRRTLIGRHFGEVWDPSKCEGMCDHCSQNGGARENVKKQDITDYAQCLLRILKQAADISERVTATKLVDAWKGRGQASLRIRGVSPPKLSQEECERVVVHLLLEGVFKEEFHFTPYSTISYLVPGPRGNSVLAGSKVKMTLVQHEKGTTKGSGKVKASKADENEVKGKASKKPRLGMCAAELPSTSCVKRKLSDISSSGTRDEDGNIDSEDDDFECTRKLPRARVTPSSDDEIIVLD